jgi:hypothetical protein
MTIESAALEMACRDLSITEKRLEVALKGIQDYLDGDYINPREQRPLQCPHGSYYYEECGQCDEIHFLQVLKEVRRAGGRQLKESVSREGTTCNNQLSLF